MSKPAQPGGAPSRWTKGTLATTQEPPAGRFSMTGEACLAAALSVGGCLGPHSEFLKLSIDAVGYLLHLFGLEREMFLAEVHVGL